MATANGLTASPSRLKVLFILDAFPDPHAGTEGQFWLLLNGLDRSKIEPAVLLLRPSPFLSAHLHDTPLKVLNVESLASFSALHRVLSAVVWAKRAGFQVAHIFFNDSAIIFPLPLKLAGLRVIVSRRDLGFWYTRANLLLLRFNARLIDAAVANCLAVKHVVEKRERIAADKVEVIYNGVVRREAPVQGDVRRKFGLPLQARLVVVVANLRPLKRNDDAVRALGRLPRALDDAHLVFVGEDRDGNGGASHRDELVRLSRSLGIETRVHFTGKLPDPTPLIREAQICMLCSETEGLSNAIIEYMVAGKPVICTDAGGNAELIEDAGNGFVVPVGDAEAIAQALERLLMDGELVQHMQRRSVERAQSLFLPQKLFDAHLALYSRLRRAS